MTTLAQKKLKVRDAGGSGYIAVYQDGSDADADATSGRKYDDAFTLGALASGRTLQIEREWIDLGTLTHSYDAGKQLSFSVQGIYAWKNDPTNTMTFNPNDTAEFFAEVPTPDATIDTATWHINETTPGTQVRLFYGHVENVQISPDNALEVTCRDPLYRANLIKLQRSAPDGITIPKIAFNLPRDNPDFYYSVKLTGTSASSPTGVGESNEEDSRCTLRDILEYLDRAYIDSLIAEDIIDTDTTSGIFVAADLASLTWKPGPIVLENTGFSDGVREILKRWAPHLRLAVDHQTTQWRLVPYGPKLTTAYATGTSTLVAVTGQPYKSGGPVDNVGIFSATAGAAGNRVRIYGGGTIAHPSYSLSEERTIHSISGSTLRFNETGLYSYVQWAAYPIDTGALPNLNLSIDDVAPGGASVTLNTDGSYTAVNLWSVYQETQSYSQSWNRQDLGSGILQPGWDTSFESVWTDKDSDRENDFGADGQGMKPYQIGNDGTNDYFDVSFAQSQYGARHTTSEWDDVTVWVWTENGASVKNSNRVYQIKTASTIADCGDGTPGLRLLINAAAGTILLDSPAFKPISDASATEDRIVLTQNKRFKTTKGNNRRWEVGRKFYFTDTTVSFDQDSTPHVATCTPRRITTDNGTETARRVVGMNANLGYPQINMTPAGAFEQLSGGGLGATFVWRRATYSRTPTGSPCAGGAGWTPPRLVEVEYETTTTTLRNARFPLTGYGGPAFGRYGLASQLDIAVEHWAEDAQTADYTDLALRIWQNTSHAHHQGTITKPGIAANGVWLDLGIDVTLYSTLSQSVYGASYGGFWGTVTELTLDFANDAVVFGFDSHSRFQELATEVYEEFGIRKKSTIPDLMALYRKLNELPKCIEGSQMGESPVGLCGERVYMKDNQTIVKHITTISGKGQQDSGASATAAAHE